VDEKHHDHIHAQQRRFTWAMESDPRLRSTVVSIVLLERSPDWDEV